MKNNSETIPSSLRAKLYLGLSLYYGYGTEADTKAAVQVLQETLNASERSENRELGDPEIRKICRILGECYYYGRGVERDYCKAFKYLKQSVLDEDYLYPDKDVEYLIGMCYYYHQGTKQDIASALYWLEDAADRGSIEAKQMLERRARRRKKNRG